MATDEGYMCRISVDDVSHQNAVRIVSCGVFKPSLDYLRLHERFPYLRVTHLTSNLHVSPVRLQDHLKREVIASHKRGERVICLYGDCFNDMNLFCDENGVARIKGHHCYEILLGQDGFQRVMDENARTYFLERDLIRNFEEYCIKPLELDDREMRDHFFRSYERLLYIRQPSDPDLIPSVKRIADYLEMHFITLDADYSNLDKMLIKLIDNGRLAK